MRTQEKPTQRVRYDGGLKNVWLLSEADLKAKADGLFQKVLDHAQTSRSRKYRQYKSWYSIVMREAERRNYSWAVKGL